MEEERYYNKIRSFVLRRGNINKNAELRFEKAKEKYLIKDIRDIKKEDSFFNSKDLILEIGFGSGDNLLNLAKKNKDINYLGAEVFYRGFVVVVNEIEKHKIKNIRLLQEDAQEFLKKLNENPLPLCFDGIHIFFPDPWSKQKHKKRRLIKREFLNDLEKILKKDGYIYIITDWKNYAKYINEEIKEQNEFIIQNKSPIKDKIGLEKGQSKFEKRALKLRHPIFEFFLQRS